MKSILTAILMFCCAYAQDDIVFPPPANASYGTTIQTVQVKDTSRTERNSTSPRRLMLSVISPTALCDPQSTYPHTPSATTSDSLDALLQAYGFANTSGSLSTLAVPVCPQTTLYESFPVVLFSHGLGLSRLLSTSQAQSVAAQGYIVVTIDHPYDANITEYPDGSSIGYISPGSTNEGVDNYVQIRSQDVKFILDQLQVPTSPLSQITGTRNQVAMFGHSLGGATAALTAYSDDRLVGIVDLDGFPYGFNTTGTAAEPIFNLPQDMTTPFLLFNADSRLDLTPYATMFDAFSGYKKRLSLADAAHVTFTDIPLIADLLGGRSSTLEGLAGTLDGVRARDAVAAYVTAFLDKVLKDDDAPLLDGPSSEWPEVAFVA